MALFIVIKWNLIYNFTETVTIKVLIDVKFDVNLKKNSFGKQDFTKVWMKCLEIARLQEAAPNTPDPLR